MSDRLRPGGVQRRRIGGRWIGYVTSGAGPDVVLIHGLGSSGRWWARVVPTLARHFTVHQVDLAGFGSSSRQPFVLDEAKGQLLALMDALEIERASLVGHSMGGLVAADLAAAAPERVERLVLVDSAAIPFRRGTRHHLRNLLRALLRLAPEALLIAVRDWLRAGPIALLAASGQVLSSDLRARLSQIEAPTLVCWGEHDPVVPLAAGHQLAATIPRARLVVVAGAAHSPMWQAPGTFAALVERFLRHPDPLRMPLPEGTIELTPAPPPRPPAPLATDMPHASRFVSTDRYLLHVRTGRSEPAKPTPSFIMVHGFVNSSRYFVPTVELLAPRYPAYAVDMPGFGLSSKPRRTLSVPQLADAVVEAQAALGLERSVFVGNSFGCQVVADIAARCPERVTAAVLTGPTFETGRSLLHHFLGLLADIPLENPRLWLLHLPDYVLAGPRRALATLRHALDDSIEAKLPQITAPTLVVRGGRDPIISAHWPRRMARLLPRGRWAEIPGAPHCVNYSTPTELVGLIERLLQLEGLSPPDRAAPAPPLAAASLRAHPRA